MNERENSYPRASHQNMKEAPPRWNLRRGECLSEDVAPPPSEATNDFHGFLYGEKLEEIVSETLLSTGVHRLLC